MDALKNTAFSALKEHAEMYLKDALPYEFISRGMVFLSAYCGTMTVKEAYEMVNDIEKGLKNHE